MIRRDVTLPDGNRYWSLISQVEHARLSAELAAAWGNEQVTPVICGKVDGSANRMAGVRQEVLSAIRHHDDGWAQWQQAPGIDPVHRRPYAFTEMPLAESLVIWQDGVLGCAGLGNLAAWMVAGHFAMLLRGSHSSNEPIASEWLAKMQSRRAQWLTRWRSTEPLVHTETLAETALFWLRSFDALSLWFCCGQTDDFLFPPITSTVRSPGRPIKLTRAGTEDIKVHPWPFSVPELVLEAPAMLAPVGAYHTSAELLEAGQDHEHRWRLLRQSG